MHKDSSQEQEATTKAQHHAESANLCIAILLLLQKVQEKNHLPEQVQSLIPTT